MHSPNNLLKLTVVVNQGVECLKIIVGSKNPVKIRAAKSAICEMFDALDVKCIGVNTPSNVPEQPMTTQATLLALTPFVNPDLYPASLLID